LGRPVSCYRKEWIEEKLKNGDPFREDRWTESLAVGGEGFVKEVRENIPIEWDVYLDI